MHNSEYDKAFVRECTEYDIYYMFDEDTNEVINFVTNDSYVMRGIYSGSFASGVDINWVDDGWHETFKNNEGSSKATLMDGNGFEWEFKDYDVDKAQKVLDKLY